MGNLGCTTNNQNRMKLVLIEMIWLGSAYPLAIKNDVRCKEVRVDYSRGDMSFELNRLSSNPGLKGMMEGKDLRTSDMVLIFVARFVDGETVLVKIHQ